MSKEFQGFAGHYSEQGLWDKVIDFAKSAGKDVIEKVLWLYYAAQGPDAPAWAKTIIFGALGYFICLIDAIPDLTPVVGYTDDLGVLAAAVTTVTMYIDADVKAKSAQKMNDWFGE